MTADGPSRRRPAEAQERDGFVGDPDAPRRYGASRRPGARRRGRGGKDEGPSPVGGLMRAVFEKLGIADRVERAAAAARWDEVVGPEIARRTGDVRVSGRTLIVEVESSSWMQELNMRRHQILGRLNAGLEGGKIEKLVFVQEGKR